MSSEAPPGEERETAASRVDSNWWYWVAAVPLYYVLATVAGFAFAIIAFGAAVTGVAGGDPGIAVGFGFLSLFGIALILAAVGMLLSILFPFAIYADAEAVERAGGDWRPDPALYGLLGLAGVIAQPLQVPLAVYYLYKRHDSVGRP